MPPGSQGSGLSVSWSSLRALGITAAVALIGLWARFAYLIFQEGPGIPAPGGVMLPVLFSMVSLGAGLASWRGDGIQVLLAGGLSLVPMGIILLLLFPGLPRLIGVLDVALILIGVLLIRAENRAFDEAEEGRPADPKKGRN